MDEYDKLLSEIEQRQARLKELAGMRRQRFENDVKQAVDALVDKLNTDCSIEIGVTFDGSDNPPIKYVKHSPKVEARNRAAARSSRFQNRQQRIAGRQ